MRRLNEFSTWFLLALMVMFAACAQLGVASADTFNKKLAAAYGSVQVIATTTAQLRDAGSITPERGKQIGQRLLEVVAALDATASMAGSDAVGADKRLTFIIATLTAIQTELASKQGSKAL